MGIFPSYDEVMKKKTQTVTKSKSLFPAFDTVIKPQPPVYNKFGKDVSKNPYNPLNPNNEISQFPVKDPFAPYQGTFKTLDELKADPFTLKKDDTWLKKTFASAWEGLKAPIVESGDRIAELFVNSKTTNEKIGNTLKATSGVAGALFSPITALFEGANQVPLLGTVSKLISLPFSVVGEAGAQLGGTIVDKLPISQEAKDQIKPGIEEIFALAGQLALGKATSVGQKKFNSLVVKYGETDAVTIVAKAQELAKEKTTGFPQPQAELKPTVVPKEFPKANPAPKTAPTEAIMGKVKGIPDEILQEAKTTKEFALAKLQDKKWMEGASDVSKKMVQDNATKSVDQIAKENWDYLKMRGTSVNQESGSYSNKGSLIDKEANAKYLRLQATLETPKLESPLLQEAKKYKSAEEFVDAQPTLYHGTSENISKLDITKSNEGNLGKGIYLTDTPAMAKEYGNLASSSKEAKLGNFTGKIPKANVVDVTVSPNAKIKELNYQPTYQEAQKIKQQGFDGIKYPDKSLQTYEGGNLTNGNSKATVIFNPDVLKTKSQLTDIYNQAKGEVKTEPVKVEGKVTKLAKDINTELASKGFDILSSETQATFDPITKKATLEKVSKFMQDAEKAKEAIRTGEVPGDFKGADKQVLFNAMEEQALKNNDVQGLIDLAQSPIATELSVSAQTLGASGFNKAEGAVAKMQEVIKAREQSATKKAGKGKTVAKVKSEEITKIKSEIAKKAPTKETWASFIESIKC